MPTNNAAQNRPPARVTSSAGSENGLPRATATAQNESGHIPRRWR
jgi:hypothetical protein